MNMNDKDREAFEQWICDKYGADSPSTWAYDNDPILTAEWEAWQAATERAKERERELVDLLEEAIFNAKSVIVNMKDMKGGAGFSVREEAEWLERAVPALKQYEESEAE